MKKKFLFSVVLLVVTSLAFAQQDAQISQFMFNKFWFNPGYAGMNKSICAKAVTRSQWVGFEGNPNTQIFTADMPWSTVHGGIGISILNDKAAALSDMDIMGSYSYHNSTTFGDFGFGIRAGVNLTKLSIGDLRPENSLDPAIPTADLSGGAPSISLGAFFKGNNGLWASLSTTKLNEPKFSLSGINKSKLERHYYIMTGYEFQLNSSFNLKPAVLIKSDGAATQLDINCIAEHTKGMWGGVSVRAGDAISALFGMTVMPGLKFGTSYDITTSRLSVKSSGSFELFVSYCFNIEIVNEPTIYRHPRFL